MHTALLGVEAIANSAAALAAVQAAGLNFLTIPEGTYEIGARNEADNPVRQVHLDSFELADTVLTNLQMAALMRKLEDNTTVMTATLPNHQAVVLARGTAAAVNKSVSYADLERAAKEVVTTGKILEAGGFATFDLSSVMRSIRAVTLKHRLLEKFDGDDQPALVSGYEASAIAAVLGVELPTDERWEVAAGDLRDPKYLDVGALSRVAHFFTKDSKQATEDVQSRAPNQYGLSGMLGNVWEWMANPYDSKNPEGERSLRGGSWGNDPESVRAAFRGGRGPDYWGYNFGVRLCRPQDS